MDKFCHKERERKCDDACQAYCIDKRHGTNCLELATQVEATKRLPDLIATIELQAFYMKVSATAINTLVSKASGLARFT